LEIVEINLQEDRYEKKMRVSVAGIKLFTRMISGNPQTQGSMSKSPKTQ
jgi:hypothetical protein